MPNERSLIESLPIRVWIEADSLFLETRKGDRIAQCDSRDWAMVIASLLNRYIATDVRDVLFECPHCHTPWEHRLMEDQAGNLTFDTLCLAQGCHHPIHIPLLRAGVPVGLPPGEAAVDGVP